jgi:hypothetical protein
VKRLLVGDLPRNTSNASSRRQIAAASKSWEERLDRLVRIANWPDSRIQRQRVEESIQQISSWLETSRRGLAECDRSEKHPQSVREIYLDLEQLLDEFDEVKISLKENQISVTTESIVLVDEHNDVSVSLGRFEIVFNAISMHTPCYRIRALTPNPASSNEEITHPHVNSGRLCEGDATGGIRSALLEGRVLDFFTLVNQVLGTYGSDSPYVSLVNWNAVCCNDCGDMSDDTSTCHSCGEYCCSECSRGCNSCGDYFCSNCVTDCAGSNCYEVVCNSCIDDDLCPCCKEEADEKAREAEAEEEEEEEEVEVE